jgi:hypothetical protein
MIIKYKTFKTFFYEMNAAGDGGVFGTATSMGHGGAVGNTGFYAPGDSRVPVALGAKKIGKKRKIVVQRRPLIK